MSDTIIAAWVGAGGSLGAALLAVAGGAFVTQRAQRGIWRVKAPEWASQAEVQKVVHEALRQQAIEKYERETGTTVERAERDR